MARYIVNNAVAEQTDDVEPSYQCKESSPVTTCTPQTGFFNISPLSTRIL
ncbi:MAG: hypothetical protein LYZ69_01860 [Nitrososphaerales archaeon]|nr:hypothetical protein [Nitrososphaerales archaeon]